MKRIKKIITAITFAVCSIIQASAQDTVQFLSLKKTCALGITNNVEVKNAGLETKKARYQLKEAESKLYPQLEGYSDFNYYFAIPKMLMPGEMFGQTGEVPVEIGTKYDWSSGFRASVTLYNQSYYTSIKIADRMKYVNELNLQQKKEELVYQVSQVYFLCKTTKSQIAHLGRKMQNTDQLLNILKQQNENGVIRKIDYSKLLVDKNNLQTQIDNLDQLYNQQLNLLKYLVGINADCKVELTDSLSFIKEYENFEQPDFDNRTELKLLAKQIEVAALTRQANREAYLPSLSGSGQFYYQGQRNEMDFLKGGDDKFFKVGSLGISLRIPIFDGFEKSAKNQQFEIELQQLENSQKNLTANYNKDFEDAVRQYKNSHTALLRQQENIKIAEDAYDICLQEYKLHVVPLSDLMMTENSLTDARLSFDNALLQYKNAELEVKKSKGRLINF